MKITKGQLRQIIREEISKVKGQKIVKEDLALIGQMAIGTAAGIVGLYALVKGFTFVKNTLGDAAEEIAYDMARKAKKAKEKAAKEGRLDAIKDIIKKFENDTKLKSLYQALPEYSPDTEAERKKQMAVIAKYIKSKLTDDEMKYFVDISSMLRTGDIK